MWKTTSGEFKHASIRMNSILLGKLHQVSQNMLHVSIKVNSTLRGKTTSGKLKYVNIRVSSTLCGKLHQLK